jgi:hypothetical protein
MGSLFRAQRKGCRQLQVVYIRPTVLVGRQRCSLGCHRVG